MGIEKVMGMRGMATITIVIIVIIVIAMVMVMVANNEISLI